MTKENSLGNSLFLRFGALAGVLLFASPAASGRDTPVPSEAPATGLRPSASALAAAEQKRKAAAAAKNHPALQKRKTIQSEPRYAKRKVVASAPMVGNAASLGKWQRRQDVMVLVYYGADW